MGERGRRTASPEPIRERAVRHRHEAPTWGVAIALHGGFLLLTWYFHAIPLPLALALGVWLVAWQGSLRHEVVHGHPTRHAGVNGLVAGPPYDLWLPLGRYHDWHHAHHLSPALADPRVDPESFYLSLRDWSRRGPWGQAFLRLQQTLAGRLLLGPPTMVVAFWRAEAVAILARDRRRMGVWARHLMLAAAVLAWLVLVAEIPLWLYLVGIVWPALGVGLLRSFDEHRPGHRSGMLRAEGPLALLFLNNNLHALHHARPEVPWYELPALARQDVPLPAGTFETRGYRQIARRHLFRIKDSPVHPGP